jgi:hypothetical protein
MFFFFRRIPWFPDWIPEAQRCAEYEEGYDRPEIILESF